jgi:hypothetical protein
MNRVFSILVVLAWGVWIGSLVGVFVAVTSLSRTFAATGEGGQPTVSEMFGLTAGNVFGLYERVQLVLAGVALLAGFAWRVTRGAAGQKSAVFVLFALAAASAVVETTYVAREIDALRQAGETKTPRFKMMHGLSFGLYSANILLLAAGGAVLPFAIAREARQRAATVTTSTAPVA